MFNYLQHLSKGKIVLWCYLWWYLVTVIYFFDSHITIWLNSLGISAVIGFALMLSVKSGQTVLDKWQIMRLFLMPFCVSSFSSLIKGQGYILIFPPKLEILGVNVAVCLGFLLLVFICKNLTKKIAKQPDIKDRKEAEKSSHPQV